MSCTGQYWAALGCPGGSGDPGDPGGPSGKSAPGDPHGEVDQGDLSGRVIRAVQVKGVHKIYGSYGLNHQIIEKS